MESPSHFKPSEDALRAFARYLAARRAGESIDFAELCKAEPRLAPELRTLADYYAVIEPLLVHSLEEASLANRLRDIFGTDVDPTIELSEEPHDETPRSAGAATDEPVRGPAQELLEQLGKQSQNDRYSDYRALGSGGMGSVFRVRDRDLRRWLALKRIHEKYAPDPLSPAEAKSESDRVLRLFLEEAQITSQLSHPSIVPVHDLGIDAKGQVYFTMKYVRGQTLAGAFERIEKKEAGWTLTRGLTILLKVCEAVGYAHAKGVVHRDLKPANVMVGPFGEVYVMDWGLALVKDRRDSHDLRIPRDAPAASAPTHVDTLYEEERVRGIESPLRTMDGRAVGTPPYMPPEQADGDRVGTVGARSDIYSIGALLYHLLTGTPPYCRRGEVRGARTVFYLLLKGPPDPVRVLAPDAPAELVAICEKAMARDPGNRYATAADVAHDLEAFLDRRPVSAVEPSLAYVLKLSIARNRTVLSAAALGLVAVGVTAAFWLREAHGRERYQLSLKLAGLVSEATDSIRPLSYKSDEKERAARWLAESELALAEAARGTGSGAAPDADAKQVESLRGLREHVAKLAASNDQAEAEAKKVYDAEWARVLKEIEANPKYAGVRLTPHPDLLPLRRDPQSGLEEFWHFRSGAKPEVGSDGKYQLTRESAVVMVLLPGMKAFKAGRAADKAAKTKDLSKRINVSIDPEFLGKFELTQGQYERVIGANPSELPPGLIRHGFNTFDRDIETTWTNPVERINHDEAGRVAAQLDGALPASFEAEYACTAGDTSKLTWWWRWKNSLDALDSGEKILEIPENLRDQSISRYIDFQTQSAFPWDDGFPETSPVGSFQANPFGLFDIAGNVEEWCSDARSDFLSALSTEPRYYFYGVSCFEPRSVIQASYIHFARAAHANPNIGMRLKLPAASDSN